MEQQTGSKLGKEYVKIVYCRPPYLTYTQSKLTQNAELSEAQAGKKLQGEISITSNNGYDTTLMVESKEELKSLLMKIKEESENACFGLAFIKLRSWHLVPSLHGKRQGKKNGNSDKLYFLRLQNHCRWSLQP